jgi:hypothetical protein
MKRVFEHIEMRAAEFAAEPLFRYLRDEALDPAARLDFVPWTAHFVMTFADLYHFFLNVDQPKDELEELVNVHLAEEGSHWKWFLADLTNAGMDPTLRFTDALRFIWSEETIRTRRLAYEICRMSQGVSSLQRLVMVQSIEATGRVALEASVPVGVELGARSRRPVVYFGQHHLDTERQHTLEEADVQRKLTDVQLEAAVRSDLFRLVDEVFHHFRGFTDEAYDIARRGRALGKFAQGATVGAA